MKKLIALYFQISAFLFTNAQTAVNDSISMGAGYANMIYYSLGTGAKVQAPAAGWDLQIWTNLMSASIRTNDGAGAQLYQLQNHDTSAWSSVDTTGMVPIYNADTSWEISAFNANQTGHPNYGWGNYTGNGNLTGIKIFVIKTVNSNFKKIWVKRLMNGDEYEFAVADLDGSNETTFTITKTGFSSKVFIYYSIDSAQVLNIEPPTTDWDVVFRRYWAVDTGYVVAGVLSHPNVIVGEARGVDVASNDYYSALFNESIAVIGYDWKTFNMTVNPPRWELADSLAYFVMAQDGYIYKVVFTGFGGSGTGKVVFSKTQIDPVSAPEFSNIRALTVYPNPAAENAQAIFALDAEADVTIRILDLSGKSHLTVNTQARSGLNILTLSTEALAQGFYLLSVDDGNNRLTYKFVRN